jgi:hypothetical protein
MDSEGEMTLTYCHPEERRIFFALYSGPVYCRRFFAIAQNDRHFLNMSSVEPVEAWWAGPLRVPLQRAQDDAPLCLTPFCLHSPLEIKHSKYNRFQTYHEEERNNEGFYIILCL